MTYTWKVEYTALLPDGREMPNQSVRHVNFWRAATFVKRMLKNEMLVPGSVKYIDLRKEA